MIGCLQMEAISVEDEGRNKEVENRWRDKPALRAILAMQDLHSLLIMLGNGKEHNQHQEKAAAVLKQLRAERNAPTCPA